MLLGFFPDELEKQIMKNMICPSEQDKMNRYAQKEIAQHIHRIKTGICLTGLQIGTKILLSRKQKWSTKEILKGKDHEGKKKKKKKKN